MKMNDDVNDLIIIGDGEFAEIAYEYFTHDSPYDVVAFSVERSFLKNTNLFGLPIVPLDELEQHFNYEKHRVFVAVTYTQLNRVRTRLYNEVKRKGFRPISYISSKAFVWHNVEIGENCFIFENNVLQHRVKVGNNVILWSGNHIGHRTVLRDHCYVTSHAVLSGYCDIGESSFLGVNCTVVDNVKVAKDCIVGAGALITRDTEEGKVYPGSATMASKASSLKVFKVKEGLG